jgi:hypothetical protein
VRRVQGNPVNPDVIDTARKPVAAGTFSRAGTNAKRERVVEPECHGGDGGQRAIVVKASRRAIIGSSQMDPGIGHYGPGAQNVPSAAVPNPELPAVVHSGIEHETG